MSTRSQLTKDLNGKFFPFFLSCSFSSGLFIQFVIFHFPFFFLFISDLSIFFLYINFFCFVRLWIIYHLHDVCFCMVLHCIWLSNEFKMMLRNENHKMHLKFITIRKHHHAIQMQSCCCFFKNSISFYYSSESSHHHHHIQRV